MKLNFMILLVYFVIIFL